MNGAMNSKIPSFVHQDSIGLIGTCVARSFKEIAFPNVTTSNYLWRINTVSLMSTAEHHIDISECVPERTDFLSVDRDLNKNFDLNSLFTNQKIILLDFVRDYYPISQLSDGRFVTISGQYETYNLWDSIGEHTFISPYSPDYIDLWLSSIIKFAEIANARDATLLIVPGVMQQGIVEGNNYKILDKFDAFDIMYKSKLLYFIENISYLYLDKSFILPSLHPFSRLSLNHIYGVGPIHLDANIDRMRLTFVEKMGDLLIRSDSMPSDVRRSAIEELTQHWRQAARAGYS